MAGARELEALEQLVGARVSRTRPVGGGDIADAEEVLLSDGRALFLKTRVDAPPTMFPAEARGLDFLREAAALRLPRVIAVSASPGLLALELVSPAPQASDFDERLGRGLAALHRFGAPTFGLDHDNYLATLEQSNASERDWPTFYRSRRLEPLVRRAADQELLGAKTLSLFDELFTRMDELASTKEPASRLHGDLWSGNVIADETGRPCLIDPAVYGGQREIDLAMMRLFGGFGPRVFDAYREAWPLEARSEARLSLYQLYPLLAHVLLFGGSYVASVERALATVLRA